MMIVVGKTQGDKPQAEGLKNKMDIITIDFETYYSKEYGLKNAQQKSIYVTHALRLSA